MAAQEAAQSFTLDGRLYKDANGTSAMVDSSVQLKIQILSPDDTCILYEQWSTVNTLDSSGYFTVQVGALTSDSSKRKGFDPGLAMSRIYTNTGGSMGGKSVSNGSNCTYAPSSADERHLRLHVTPSGDGITRVVNTTMPLDSVPSAMVAERAESLQGLSPSQFLQVSTTSPANLSQANVENVFSNTNYSRLVSILSNGTSGYAQTGSNGSVLVPTVGVGSTSGLTSGQMWFQSGVLKYYDGTAIQTVGASGSGITSLVAGEGLTGGTISTGGQTIAVDVGTTSGQIVQVQGGGKLPALDASNLTNIPGGSFKNSVISGSTSISITGNIQTTGSSTQYRTYLYDHSGAGPGYVGFAPPADMAGSGGASYTLTFPDRVGQTGQVLTATTGTGTLSWTTPNALTNVTGDITLSPVAGSGSVLIDSGTASSSSGTGALLVTGGVGVSGAIYSGTSINAGSSVTAVTSVIAPRIFGSVSPGGSLRLDGTSDSTPGNVYLASNGGKVGIGTTSPSQMLHVYTSTGNVTAMVEAGSSTNAAYFSARNDSGSQLLMSEAGSGSSNTTILTIPDSGRVATTGAGGLIFNSTNAGAPIRFATGGSAFGNERMRIDAAGFVGIGTTSPTSALHVASGDITLQGGEIIQNTGDVITFAGTRSLTLDLNDSSGYPMLGSSASYIKVDSSFLMNNGGTIRVNDTGNDRYATFAYQNNADFQMSNSAGDMNLLPAGNVGIGTTSAGARLGIVQATDLASGGLRVQNSGGSRSAYLWVDANGVSRLDSGVSGNQALTLNVGGGSVGIGSTSTNATLHVNAGVNSLYLKRTSGLVPPASYSYMSYDGLMVSVYQDSTPFKRYGDFILDGYNGNGSAMRFFTSGSGTGPAEALRIENNGAVGIGVTTPSGRLQLAAGTTAMAPLKFMGGPNLSTPQPGAMEFDGSNLYITDNGGTRHALASSTNSVFTGTTSFGGPVGIGRSPGQLFEVGDGSNTFLGVNAAGYIQASPIFGNDGKWRFDLNAGMGLSSDVGVSWSSTTGSNGAKDLSIGRNAAGVLEINNGTAGVYRDLQLRAINPTAGNLGIGTTAPTSKLDISDSPTATSGLLRTLTANLSYWPGSASTANIQGLYLGANSGSANVTGAALTGSQAEVTYTGSGASNLGSATGQLGNVANTSSGSIGTAYGVQGKIDNNGSGTVWGAYGLYSKITNTGGGTVAAAYGLYIDTVSGTAKFGVFQSDATNKNYFAGNVGIGTTTATKLLEVYDGTNSTSVDGNNIYFSRGSTNYIRATNASGELAITTGGNTVNFRVTNAGHTQLVPNGGNVYVGSTSSILPTRFEIRGTTSDSTASGLSVIDSTGISKFLVRNDGYVGIGTTTPGSLLTVNGDLRVAGNILDGTGQSVFSNTGRYTASVGSNGTPSYSFQGDPNTGMFSAGADQLGFATNGLQRMIVDENGHVGIGTTTPDGQINVMPGSAGTIGLVVQGLPSQTGHLQEWRTSSGAETRVYASGALEVNNHIYMGWDTNVSQKPAYSSWTDTYITSGASGSAAKNILLYPSAGGYIGLGTTNPTSPVTANMAGTNATINPYYFFNTTLSTTSDGDHSTRNMYNRISYKVGASKTETGSIIGNEIRILRNQSGTGDNGSHTANQIGQQIIYGHDDSDGAATPTTTAATGLRIYPYYKTGTVTTMYDIYLNADTSGGAATTHYGIYQANTARNYFAGKVGIGTTNPNSMLEVAGATGPSAAATYYQGVNLSPAITATANLQFLNGVVINPTFSNGAFTVPDKRGLVVAADTWIFPQQGQGFSQLFMPTGGSVNGGGITNGFFAMKSYTSSSKMHLGMGAGNDHSALSSELLHLSITDGFVGIGTTAPNRALEVNGAIRIVASTSPGTPGTGDIFIDSGDSNKLKWWNGSTWQSAGGSGALTGVTSVANSGGDITLSTAAGSGRVYVDSNTASTMSSNGALVVVGGVGVSGDVNTGGAIYAGSSISAANSVWSPQIYGSSASAGNLRLDGTSHATPGNVFLASNGGKVGVGTSAPGSRLEIAQSADTSSGGLRITGTGGSHSLNLWTDSSLVGHIDSYTNGAGNIAINVGGGLVGIGTSAPSYTLDVVGNQRLNGAAGGQVFSLYSLNSTAMAYIGVANNGGILNGIGTGEFAIAAQSTKLHLSTTGGPNLTIATNGNVGIGTTAPSQMFQVVGGTGQITNTGAPAGYIFERTDGAAAVFYAGQNNSAFQYDSSYPFEIKSNTRANVLANTGSGATSRLYIHTNGNVGISQDTSPSSRLEIKGAGTTSATSALNATDSAGTSLLFVRNDGKVGIGTTTPSSALDVNGTVRSLASVEAAVNLGSSLSGTVTMDLANGSYFYGTVTGTTTFAVSNAAASGYVSSFTLELTNGGSQTVNWMSGTKWPGGAAPTLTSSGTDLLVCSTRDGGTVWRCVASEVDSK